MYQSNENCRRCGLCVEACPVEAIEKTDNGVVTKSQCIECGVCVKVCPFEAIEKEEKQEVEVAICQSCPIQCKISSGNIGACKRYKNEKGTLIRNRILVENNPKIVPQDSSIERPIITGVGAGTNYPCIRPAPYIVSETRQGIDVVTVVTEAPLSYSGLTLKLDTNTYIGEEGDPVYRKNQIVGMVNTEEYGSKMIAIGGANKLTDKNGYLVAKTIVELANGQPVDLSVNKATKLRVQAGKAPVINGKLENKMRIGCGSATVGLFADHMKAAVDECIVIDHHVVGLFSEHLAGQEVGAEWSGIQPNAKKSSRGRYFGERGEGIGGTVYTSLEEAIGEIDESVVKEGARLLVVTTTGEDYGLFRIDRDKKAVQIPMDPQAMEIVQLIYKNCEPARTSIMYVGGTGGSARGGVCKEPLALSKAVHEGKATLTIGGAPTFILPGGGINFIVDTEKVVDKAFTWVPTPATVAPIEYTIRLDEYKKIGGHMDKVKTSEEIKQKR